jgi:hypothetical protein
MDGRTDGRTDRHTYWLTDEQTDRKRTDGPMHRETYRQIRLGIYDKEQFVKSAINQLSILTHEYFLSTNFSVHKTEFI